MGDFMPITAENDIKEHEEVIDGKRVKVVDLTNIKSTRDSEFGGVVRYDSYGSMLCVERKGSDLVLKYNGEWKEINSGSEYGYPDYVDYKIYKIKNYFSGKLDVRIKADYYDAFNGELIEKGKIFDLKEIATLTYGNNDKIERNLVIKGTFVRDEIDGGLGNDVIYGYGGDDLLYGYDGNDIIYGGDGNDIIYGGQGDDKLYGGSGKNELYFEALEELGGKVIGDGHDLVYSTSGGEDTIVFCSPLITAEDISFDAHGNNLIIKYATDSSITIVDYLKNPVASSVKYIRFDGDDTPKNTPLSGLIASKVNKINGTDGADILKGTALTDVITGGRGNDKLYGGKGENTFVFKNGDGNDIVYYEGGTDIIDLTGTDLIYNPDADDFLTCKENNDLIIKYNGETDEVRLANYFKSKGNSKIRLKVNGIDGKGATEIGLDKVYVDANYFDETRGRTIVGTFLNDEIDGTQGNDTIKGGAGDDVIAGNMGNDKLYGETGNNKFYFCTGDGHDTIYQTKGANDTINFSDDNTIKISELKIGAKGNDVVITYGKDYNDSVTISGYLKNYQSNSSANSVKTIAAADGAIEDLQRYIAASGFKFETYGVKNIKNNLKGTVLADIIKGGDLNDVLSGYDGDDILYGEGGNDIIYGGNGNDVLYGGKGDDKLYGDAGRNTYYFKEGDGKDTVYMNAKGIDTIVFGSSLESTVNFDKSGNNLVINYGTNGDSVTIVNYLSTRNPSVKNIVFADYNKPRTDFTTEAGWKLSDIIIQGKIGALSFENLPNSVIGGQFNGNRYNNLIIAADRYSVVEAGDGNDTIYLQSKQAAAYGENGNDRYIVSSLANTTYIEDNAGNDKLQILDSYKNIKLLFNIEVNGGKIANSSVDIDGLYILNNSTYSRVKTKGVKAFYENLPAVCIDDFSNTKIGTSVKTIETKDGYYLGETQLNKLREEVASWLAANDYTSALNVLGSGDKADINNLLAVYQNNTDWQKMS